MALSALLFAAAWLVPTRDDVPSAVGAAPLARSNGVPTVGPPMAVGPPARVRSPGPIERRSLLDGDEPWDDLDDDDEPLKAHPEAAISFAAPLVLRRTVVAQPRREVVSPLFLALRRLRC